MRIVALRVDTKHPCYVLLNFYTNIHTFVCVCVFFASEGNMFLSIRDSHDGNRRGLEGYYDMLVCV